ncbi:YihY/virulence factor BrkB family protein [Mangrovactinospora gilvigrisea]|nr:YihY/virulence factor BrkB family protein [Mangrovactinospora gilvigrisea]
MTTHVWLAYSRYSDAMGDRLAGSVTYFGFLSVFPLLALSGAIGSALLTKGQLDAIQEKLSEQIPGIADQLNLHALSNNAGAVSVIGLLVLLYSGIGGVGVTRTSVRTIWEVKESTGNPFKQKAVDLIALVGLLVLGALTLGGSALTSTLAGRAAHALGLESTGVGKTGLQVLAVAIAVVAGFMLFAYALTGLSGLRPPRRAILTGAAIGAIGFEALKQAMSGYLTHVAGKSIYGAFGTPIALLVWIDFAARLLLLCAAWMATSEGAGPQCDLFREDGGKDEDADPEPDPEPEPESTPKPEAGQPESTPKPGAGQPERKPEPGA